MVLRTSLVLLISFQPVAEAAVPLNCAAGVPLGDLRLTVQSTPGKPNLPLRGINRLGEGDKILYSPVKLRVNPKGGKVALVIAPAPTKPGEPVPTELPKLEVLEPIDANRPGEWKVPFRVGVIALVYGPEGINAKRVKDFLTKEDDLIAQMADYAEKTAQTEALLAALSSGTPINPTQMDAALNGFGTQYGITAGIDRTLPRDQQLGAMLRTVNPSLAVVDPVASDSSARLQTTAILATTVAGLFFGSPIGLAAGGTALFMNLRTMFFPGTEFRSSFAQIATPPVDDLNLCGKREPPKPRTKIAYLWANRIPNAGPPTLTMGPADHLPQEQKGLVNVSMDDAAWQIVDRARQWMLVDAKTKKEFPVQVHSVPAEKSLEVDLSGAKAEPGLYELKASWDWNPLAVKGAVFVEPLGNLEGARLAPESQDQLLEQKGRMIVQVEGADFEFVEKATLQKTGDKFHQPEVVPFSLPLGKGRGLQDRLALELETKALQAGSYSLTLTQTGGKSYAVPIKILPPGPTIENAPIDVNLTEDWQHVTLKGENLERLAKLESNDAIFQLGDVKNGERDVRVHLSAAAREGAVTDLLAFAQDVSKPTVVTGGVRVNGPSPRIVGAQISLPPQNRIPLKEGELPTGGFVSASLQVKNASGETRIRLRCAKSSAANLTLRAGEQNPRGNLQLLSSDSLFLSFDPGMWQAGCEVVASLENGAGGASKTFGLGRVIRLPHIDTFELSEEKSGDNYAGKLTGTDLETIAQVGWTGDHGIPVAALPTPFGGDSRKQSLPIVLPWPPPSPHAPIFIWLRGESEGRATQIHY
jgi:hypothetical protein